MIDGARTNIELDEALVVKAMRPTGATKKTWAYLWRETPR
jgi:Arc/MetJ family transcription regulator